MGLVITFANQKGGVGKTTTSLEVSVGLAKRGKRVLAIDVDPQANLTSTFIQNGEDMVSLYDLFEGDCTIHDTIVPTESGVDLVPGSLMLSGADRRYSKTGDEYKLKESLAKVHDKYDYIVLDTPPSLGMLSLSALACTDYLCVVATPDFYSSKGLSQLQDTVETAQKYLSNPGLKINGLLLTQCDRTNLTSIMIDDLEKIVQSLNSKIYKSRIRRAVAIRESQYLESSLYDIKHTSVLRDYEAFIDELLKDVES